MKIGRQNVKCKTKIEDRNRKLGQIGIKIIKQTQEIRKSKGEENCKTENRNKRKIENP